MSFGSEEKQAVLRVMERGILSGYQGNWSEAFYGGPEVKELEREWAECFGVKHAICCNSATSGLWLACAAIGIGYEAKEETVAGEWFESLEEDEVTVTPYSMTCSASIPLHFGAKPVFADIEPDYYCLDPKSIEERITERTKAIIVVDLFGQPYDADAINAIAKKHGLYVIEDAAQAIGAKYKGKYAGTLGDIGVYSLNRHKHIQCGEGGVVVTDNDELAFKLRLAMNHAEAVMNDLQNKVYKPMGNTDWVRIDKLDEDNLYEQGVNIDDNNIWSLVGMNLRMTELQAAVTREQLKKLDGILQVIRYHAEYFPVKVRPDCEHAYYRYAWDDVDGNELSCYLRQLNITLPSNKYSFKDHYITPLYKMPLFKQLGYPDNLCPVCEEVDKNITLAWLKGIL